LPYKDIERYFNEERKPDIMGKILPFKGPEPEYIERVGVRSYDRDGFCLEMYTGNIPGDFFGTTKYPMLYMDTRFSFDMLFDGYERYFGIENLHPLFFDCEDLLYVNTKLYKVFEKKYPQSPFLESISLIDATYVNMTRKTFPDVPLDEVAEAMFYHNKLGVWFDTIKGMDDPETNVLQLCFVEPDIDRLAFFLGYCTELVPDREIVLVDVIIGEFLQLAKESRE